MADAGSHTVATAGDPSIAESAEQAARERQRLTRTVFADRDGVGEALAEILGGANVTVAKTLEEALVSDAEVLVLSVDARQELGLSPAQVKDLKARKLLFTGTTRSGWAGNSIWMSAVECRPRWSRSRSLKRHCGNSAEVPAN